MTARSPWLPGTGIRLLVWLGVVAGATLVITLTGGYLFLSFSAGRLANDLLATVILLAWLGAALLRPQWNLLPRSRMWPAIMACLAAFAISTATSRNPRLSIEMLGYAILLALLYLLLVRLMASTFLRPRLGALAGLLAVIVCLLYLGDVALRWQQWWGLVGHFALPPLRPAYDGLAYGSPNIVATVVLVLGAMGAARIGLSSRARIFAALALAALVAITVLISGSRGAWVGTAAAIVMVGLAWALDLERRERARVLIRQVSPRWRLAAVALAAAVVVVGFLLLRSRLTLDDHDLRATYTAVSLRMFAAAPLTGVGPGTWSVLRAGFTANTELDFWNPHAQSLYLQTVAEFGLLGILAGAVLVGCFAWLLRNGLQSADILRRRVAYGATFALALLAVQQVVDFFANLPAVLFAVALPIAWLDATADASPFWTRLHLRLPSIAVPPRALTTALILAVLVTTLGMVRIEAVAAQADQGAALAAEGRWSDAEAHLAAAAREDPDLPIYQFMYGVVAANAGDHDAARIALRRAAEGDDYSLAWIDLAGEDLRLGDVVAARADGVRGERLGSQHANSLVAASFVRSKLMDAQIATQDLADAVTLLPSLSADPSGLASILSGVSPDRVIDLALDRLEMRRRALGDQATDRERAWIGILSDRPSLVSDALADLASDGYSPIGLKAIQLAQEGWSGNGEAVDSLWTLAEDHPQLSAVVPLAAFVAAHQERSAQAERARVWSRMGLPFSDASRAWRFLIVDGHDAGDLIPSPTGQYASAYRQRGLAVATTAWLPALAQR